MLYIYMENPIYQPGESSFFSEAKQVGLQAYKCRATGYLEIFNASSPGSI